MLGRGQGWGKVQHNRAGLQWRVWLGLGFRSYVGGLAGCFDPSLGRGDGDAGVLACRTRLQPECCPSLRLSRDLLNRLLLGGR